MSAQIDEETTQPSADASPSPTPKKMRRMLPATRRGWVAAVLGVALLIGAGGFGAWWFFGRPRALTPGLGHVESSSCWRKRDDQDYGQEELLR